ncbi:MAG: Na/Pi cotransporter family protein [Bdellovibrionales bacterium]|nr:Na/Pi cotransporter family protein [Bdellovibrionales bacterium]
MFGISIISKQVQKLSSNSIRDLISRLDEKRSLGVFVGVLLTMVIQSSGAVTSMLVGLGSAGVLNLGQVMSVILGAAVGSTITVQLLSLNITQIGMPVFAIAYLISFLTRKKTLERIMRIIMGFGLLFWGLEVISAGTSELRNLEAFSGFIGYLNENPFVTLVFSTVITAIVHSSAVTVGFALSLAQSGIIDLTQAFYWVYGANIGTTAVALLAATGGNYVGRQIAWAHVFAKSLTVFVLFFLTSELAHVISTGVLVRDIANAHTLLNVIMLVAFFPFLDMGVKFIQYLFPPSQKEKDFGAKFLNVNDFDSPHVALAHAEREALRLGDIVNRMMVVSIKLFEKDDKELQERVKISDNQVDILNHEIKSFLANHLEDNTKFLNERFMSVMSFVTDLENVADVIDNSVLDLAKKMHALKLKFSDEGWGEIVALHKELVHLTTLSLTTFQVQEKDRANEVISLKRKIRNMEQTYRETHLRRVFNGNEVAMKSSSVHLDLISEYRRASGLLANHAYRIIN